MNHQEVMQTVKEFRHEVLRERYYYTEHSSGLPIYVFPKELTTATVLYATRFGSVDSAFTLDGASETVLPDGCAHFLEHKMFEEADGSDAFLQFSALGADANAYTSWDKTAYLFQATASVYECLEALLRFVSSPHFTKKSVKKEQGIIAQEIRMSSDHPGEQCFLNALCALYKDNPVRKDIGGTEESIRKITPEILYECYRTFYHPHNMALVLVGQVTMPEVLAVVDRVFSELHVGEETPPVIVRRDETAREERRVHMPRIETQMQVGQPIFSIVMKDYDAVFLSVREQMRRDALMMFIKELYFSPSSELYLRLLDEGRIMSNFSAGYVIDSRYAFFEISGESDDPDGVLLEVKKTVRDAQKTGIDGEAFIRAKRVLYAKTIKTFDETYGVARFLLDAALEGYDLFEYVDLFDEITKDEVEALLRTVFTEESLAISIVSPLPEAVEAEDAFEQ